MSPDTSPIILCEGKSDEVFIENLFKHHSLSNFHIQKLTETDAGGCSGFTRRLVGLKTDATLPSRKAVIIIRNNDDNFAASFKEVQECIANAKQYDVPLKPRILSKSGPLPPVSVLMLPWDEENGCLETLLLKSAESRHSQGAECVDKFVSCLNAHDWEVSKKSKLRLRCLLSGVCKDDPMVGLPFAWTSSKNKAGELIPLGHDCFANLLSYFKSFA